MYSDPLSAWKAWTVKGEGGDEVFQYGDHELLGDAADGSKVLELCDFVDDVDDVGALPALQIAEVDGVDAQEPGPAVRPRPAAHAEAHRGGVGLAEGEAAGSVDAGSAEVVDVAVRDPGEPLEALVAVDMAHAPQDRLGRRSGELAEGLVDLGKQGRVTRGVAARERLGGGLSAVVADPPAPAVLLHQAGDLGPRVARHLLQEPLHQTLVIPLQAVVPEADQRPADEGVGGGPVGEPEVHRLVAFHEGAHLVECLNPFGAKCHDHAPMISSPRASGSSLVGNRLPARAHLSLDKTKG